MVHCCRRVLCNNTQALMYLSVKRKGNWRCPKIEPKVFRDKNKRTYKKWFSHITDWDATIVQCLSTARVTSKTGAT